MSKHTEENLEKLMSYLEDYTSDNGFPPSVREICNYLGIKSTATAYYYLEKLKTRGLISKSPAKNRAVSVNRRNEAQFLSVPVLGKVTAGDPITAIEHCEEYYPLPTDFAPAGSEMFMLNVRGDSMIDAGIHSGDKIIVRRQNTANNGDIVVAMIDDSATVKRFYKRSDHIVLHPENESMSDIILNDVVILGKVLGLTRKF